MLSLTFKALLPFSIVHVISWRLDHHLQKDYINKPHLLLNPERLPLINKHAAHYELLTFSIITYAEAVLLLSVFFIFFPHMAAVGNMKKLQRGLALNRILLHPLCRISTLTHPGGPGGLGVFAQFKHKHEADTHTMNLNSHKQASRNRRRPQQAWVRT